MSEFLRLAGVTKRFGGLVAVKSVSFIVEQGPIFGIIGPNGAGKSTLFAMMAGFDQPSEGEISFRGHPLNGLSPFRINRLGIGRTFQTPELFPQFTALETVTTAGLQHLTLKESRRQAEEVIERLQMSEKRDALVSELTVAGQKRLEVARALATGAELLLLDECLAGLTDTEMADMISLIKMLRKEGKTILIVEHVMKVIMDLCDRIVVLSFGEKIAEGSPDEISRDPKVIEAYLGSE